MDSLPSQHLLHTTLITQISNYQSNWWPLFFSRTRQTRLNWGHWRQLDGYLLSVILCGSDKHLLQRNVNYVESLNRDRLLFVAKNKVRRYSWLIAGLRRFTKRSLPGNKITCNTNHVQYKSHSARTARLITHVNSGYLRFLKSQRKKIYLNGPLAIENRDTSERVKTGIRHAVLIFATTCGSQLTTDACTPLLVCTCGLRTCWCFGNSKDAILVWSRSSAVER